MLTFTLPHETWHQIFVTGGPIVTAKVIRTTKQFNRQGQHLADSTLEGSSLATCISCIELRSLVYVTENHRQPWYAPPPNQLFPCHLCGLPTLAHRTHQLPLGLRLMIIQLAIEAGGFREAGKEFPIIHVDMDKPGIRPDKRAYIRRNCGVFTMGVKYVRRAINGRRFSGHLMHPIVTQDSSRYFRNSSAGDLWDQGVHNGLIAWMPHPDDRLLSPYATRHILD